MAPVISNLAIGLAKHIQMSSIVWIRECLKGMRAHPQYKNSIIDQDIAISGEFPRVEMKYPCIVVTIPKTAELYKKILGREQYQPIFETQENGKKKLAGYRLGGLFASTFQIAIACESQTERRELLDLVAILMRTVGAKFLHTKWIDITSMDLGGERIERVGSDNVYWDTLNIKVNTQWKQELLGIPLVESVKVIDVKPVHEKLEN